LVLPQQDVEAFLAEIGPPFAAVTPDALNRPFVTLSFAQSLDGSITATEGAATALSGAESLVLTHALRSVHDAILIGIGTVLADDPRLNVREWTGDDPVPVILDTSLQTPGTARFLSRQGQVGIHDGERGPVVFYRDEPIDPVRDDRKRALEAAGARCVPVDPRDLPGILRELAAMGFSSVMVEGGAGVIASFLEAKCVDRVVVTVAPRFLGGFRYEPPAVELDFPKYARLGDDLIVAGEPVWR
jgi:3,4-dihydroxy 2-butanone 4-phosphate synthase/GTP cyclohydrolase II